MHDTFDHRAMPDVLFGHPLGQDREYRLRHDNRRREEARLLRTLHRRPEDEARGPLRCPDKGEFHEGRVQGSPRALERREGQDLLTFIYFFNHNIIMRDVRIRLVLNKKLEEHEVSAANEAAGRFRAFGLGVETVSDPSTVWKDLTRLNVYQMVLGESPITLFGDEPLGRPLSASRVPHDGAILAGLTTERILHQQTHPDRESGREIC